MSCDGWPPDLQSLRSKICLFSLKSSTFILKTDFSLYRLVKIGDWAIKIGARTSLSCTKRVPSLSKSGPKLFYSGPDILRIKVLFWWLEFGARMLGFGARIELCWKFKFFNFCAFVACSSMNYNEYLLKLHKKCLLKE